MYTVCLAPMFTCIFRHCCYPDLCPHCVGCPLSRNVSPDLSPPIHARPQLLAVCFTNTVEKHVGQLQRSSLVLNAKIRVGQFFASRTPHRFVKLCATVYARKKNIFSLFSTPLGNNVIFSLLIKVLKKNSFKYLRIVKDKYFSKL